MQYLFFDIECASCDDGGKLCEFGYVLTDEDFEPTERENFVINPRCKFDYFVIKKILNRPKEAYFSAPDFKFFYPRIYALLTRPGVIVVGHTTQGDAEHIGDDCLRYGLHSPDFDYIDIVDIYKGVRKENNAAGLTKMAQAYEIDIGEKAHSADADALYTMEVTKKLCEQTALSLPALIAEYPESEGRIENYADLIKSKLALKALTERAIADGTYAGGEEKRVYSEFLRAVKVNEAGAFYGVKVSVSENFVNFACLKAISLASQLAEKGVKVVPSSAACDIFIRYDLFCNGEKVFCRKLPIAEKAARRGKTEILTLDEACGRFGIEKVDGSATEFKAAKRVVRVHKKEKEAAQKNPEKFQKPIDTAKPL